MPPRSPTIVGSAVETIVWSSDASSRTSRSAPKIRRTRRRSSVTVGRYRTVTQRAETRDRAERRPAAADPARVTRRGPPPPDEGGRRDEEREPPPVRERALARS